MDGFNDASNYINDYHYKDTQPMLKMTDIVNEIPFSGDNNDAPVDNRKNNPQYFVGRSLFLACLKIEIKIIQLLGYYENIRMSIIYLVTYKK